MASCVRLRGGRACAFACVLALALTGCSVGPGTVARDRFDYGESLARSSRQELLTNIVRLRYMEAPTFMSVTSVVNQYSVEGEIRGGGSWNSGGVGVPSSNSFVGGSGRYADRPTITYAPMVGQHYTASILTPIRPQAVVALIESGWKAQTLLPLTIHSINGVRNRFYGGAQQRELDPRFVRLVELMGQMQADGTLSIRVLKEQETADTSFVMILSGAEADAQVEQVAEFKRLLGLNPDTDRYRIVFGAVAADDTEIALVTRSIFAILGDMSSYVRVPEAHVAEGLAMPGAPTGNGMEHPMVVHGASDDPGPAAFVKIRHRGLWYWIADRDLKSKRTFAVLQLMAMLAESPDAAQTPLLTIPAGG